MLQPGPKPYLPPTLSKDGNSWAHLERLSSVSGISRSSIASTLSQIHGPWLLHLGARERIAILEATSSLYACLGYRRKEAYILREVLGCILDLMVCGREEDGLSRISSVPGTSGLGIQGMNPSSGGGWNSVGVRVSESTDGNDSILELLKYLCKVLGINLDAVKLVDVNPSGFPSVVADDNTSLSYEDYDNDTFESTGTYGWPDLQVGVVREAVAVAEALPGKWSVEHKWISNKRHHVLRFSCCGSVCAFGTQNSANCSITWRSISSLLNFCTRFGYGSKTRRHQVCRILVWATCC